MKSNQMFKKLIIISVVFCITVVSAIAVATAGSQGYQKVLQVSVSSAPAEAPRGKTSLTPEEKQEAEIEKIINERTSKTPPTKPATPQISGTPATPTQNKIATPSTPSRQGEYDALVDAFFGESARSVGSTSPHSEGLGGTSSEDAKREAERKKIENEMKKLRAETLKRMNTIAHRLRLDEYQRQNLTQITEETLEQIQRIREQFAGSQMTDYDKQLMQSQIKDAYAASAERIRYTLGDEKYKEFRKENVYYENPDQRIYDKMDELSKQNQKLLKELNDQEKQLNNMQKKFSQPNQPRRTGPSQGGPRQRR